MKKMMMALAAVFAAVAVNAASVNWSSGNLSTLPAGAGTYATVWQGQTMTYFLVGSAAYDLNPLITALSNGEAFSSTGNDLQKALGGSPGFSASGTGTTTTFANGDFAYGYGIVFSKDGTQFAISKVGTSAVFSSGLNASLALGGAANFTVYTIVPEPTSMALLALGVAAIGLRRRFKK